MFKIKNNHSPNYSADLFKLPLRMGLRSSNYSHFLGYLLIVLRLNLHFPTVGPFYGTLPTILTSITFLLSFHEALRTLLFKRFVAVLLKNVESALHK